MADSYYDTDFSGSPPASVSFTNSQLKYLETAHLRVICANTTSDTSTTFLQTDTGNNGSVPPFTVAVADGTTTVTFGNMTVPVDTNRIRIQRVTPSSSLLTTFSNASLLRAEDLNSNSDQLLYVLQEQLDAGTGSLPLTSTDVYDAGNKKIANVKDGTDDQDAATYGQLSVFAMFSGNEPATVTSYSFTTGAGGDGTFSSPHTTFLFSPVPQSDIDAGFLVELGGVLQRPGTDFSISGNTLTFLNQNLTTGAADTLIVQAFGLSRYLFNWPVVGNSNGVSETPLTLQGYASGDATALLSVKDSGNTENASVTAGGTVKAKVVQPNSGGTLAVNPTTITTTGAVVSGGDVTVGAASITQSSGNAQFNQVTLSGPALVPADNVPTRVVTKAYVDAYGGLTGTALGPTTGLNTLTTPAIYRGTAPASGSSYNYPSDVSGGDLVALQVLGIGGDDSGKVAQIFYNEADNRSYLRHYNSGWTAWVKLINSADSLSDLQPATGTLSIGADASNKKNIQFVAEPTETHHAATKNYIDSENKITTLGSFTISTTGTAEVCEFTPPAGDSFSNYERIVLSMESVTHRPGGTQLALTDMYFALRLFQSDGAGGFDRLGAGAYGYTQSSTNLIEYGHGTANGTQTYFDVRSSNNRLVTLSGDLTIRQVTFETDGVTAQYDYVLTDFRGFYHADATPTDSPLFEGNILYRYDTSDNWATGTRPSIDKIALVATRSSLGGTYNPTHGRVTLY